MRAIEDKAGFEKEGKRLEEATEDCVAEEDGVSLIAADWASIISEGAVMKGTDSACIRAKMVIHRTRINVNALLESSLSVALFDSIQRKVTHAKKKEGGEMRMSRHQV